MLNDKFNGFGIMTSKSGEAQIGQWKDNIFLEPLGISEVATSSHKTSDVLEDLL